MKRTMTIAAAGLALLAGGWMSVEHAAQPEGMEMPDMEQMLAMMEEASKPDTAHHEMLARMVGDWKLTAKFTMEPGAPPEISKGTCSNKMILGGRQLMGDVQMDVSMMGKNMPMTGISIMGYDKGMGEFQSLWISDWDTSQLYSTGGLKDDAIVIKGSGKGIIGDYTMKHVIRFVDGGYDMEFWEKNAMTGGEMMHTGVIEYRK